MYQITKRIIIYLVGLFLLGFGVSFSIKAELGVSAISSLGYAITLITGISVGTGMFLSNIVYIAMQVILTKKVELKNYVIQMLAMLLLSVFIDITGSMTSLLPVAQTMGVRILYLAASIVIIAFSAFLYLSSRLPVMPYDSLLPIMSKKFSWTLGKAKTIGDLLNVVFSLAVCIVFLHSFGSIGIGTFIAAYFIGKLLGVIMKYLKAPLTNWLGEIER